MCGWETWEWGHGIGHRIRIYVGRGWAQGEGIGDWEWGAGAGHRHRDGVKDREQHVGIECRDRAQLYVDKGKAQG